MSWFYEKVVWWVFWLSLKLRYRVTYKGIDRLTPEALPKEGGILFMPNHPSVLIDPVLVSLPIWKKFHPRPLVTEWAYFLKGGHAFMKGIRALPVPDLTSTRNSVKLHRNERTFQEFLQGLREGENFLMYPSGTTKVSGREVLGGASGAHRVLEEVPEVNIVLVRINGLWGSTFSRAFTGTSPKFWTTMARNVKAVLKSLIFFLPQAGR